MFHVGLPLAKSLLQATSLIGLIPDSVLVASGLDEAGLLLPAVQLQGGSSTMSESETPAEYQDSSEAKPFVRGASTGNPPPDFRWMAVCPLSPRVQGNNHTPHSRRVFPRRHALWFRLTTLVLFLGGVAMREVQLREAKVKLSALVEEAAQGETAVITRHGKPRAVILGVDEWNRLRQVPSFGRLLLSSPLEDGDLPPRDTNPSRDVAL